MNDRAARREIRARLLSSCRTFKPVIASWFDGRKRGFPDVENHSTPEQARSALLEKLDAAHTAADEAGRKPLALFFRFVPFWALAAVIIAIHLWLGLRAGGGGLSGVWPSLAVSWTVLLGVWALAFVLSLPIIKRAAALLANARTLEARALELSAARFAAVEESIRQAEAGEKQDLSEVFQESGAEWRTRISEGQKRLDARLAAIPARLERLYQKRLAAAEAGRDAALNAARAESEERLAAFEEKQAAERAVIEAEARAEIDQLAAAWNADAAPSFERIPALDQTSREAFPEWTEAVCESWEPPSDAPDAVRVGSVELDADRLADGLPADESFHLTGDGRAHAPFALGFPYDGSLLIETDGPDDGAAARALHAVALRLIASHPPGRASFLFIDPVGLGKDFSGLMHLADYEESLITSRIWTQSTHIEERLAEIKEHIEKVIQMYLRDEYPDIRAYNEQAGTIAEKSRFLVIAGFPSGFSETAAKRLRSIAASGARCGVHLLIHRDTRQEMPDTALAGELQRVCHRVTLKNGVFRLAGAPQGADVIVFDPPPSMQDSVTLVHRIGRASVDSNRVEVPFAQVAPPPGEEWSLDTGDELRVPVGRTGAKKLQMLAIGKGTKQHALVAGKTGSGKSTLFHVIITNLARWASPDQVEFYLVDFKKGVEFKCYAEKKLPHARVVAIESDREFALSVLQRVDAELKRRGELFRKAGSQDLPGYRRTPGALPMPRTLLLIDEFQEFFTEDDAVAQEASLLLDRVVRQGRAFGIHVILGSQTLGGAYTLARATLGQMVIRVALQCNETDAHLIMD
ncbi:MAG TPA: FtsK/SpoIIIE domain-containing protein, partial [Luteolibacter sp.]|nr:FtsK/SpoIIIE domain-containing protein [Luteolibacter sp.]